MNKFNILVLLFVQKCVSFAKFALGRDGNEVIVVDTKELAVNTLKGGDTNINTILLSIENSSDASFPGEIALSTVILGAKTGIKSFVINDPENKGGDIIKVIKSLESTIDQELMITVTNEPLIVISIDDQNKVLYDKSMEDTSSISDYEHRQGLNLGEIDKLIQLGKAIKTPNWLEMKKIALEHQEALEDSKSSTISDEKTGETGVSQDEKELETIGQIPGE